MELFESSERSSIPEQIDYTDHRVTWEAHRLMGLLRFAPEQTPAGTRYIARCAPDYFVLPLLADHFSVRFGETSWVIIDERRNCMVYSDHGRKPELCRINQANGADHNDIAGNTEEKDSGRNSGDEWVDLWKNYHHSINNEARANPKLQKKFMPLRFRKYLPEIE